MSVQISISKGMDCRSVGQMQLLFGLFILSISINLKTVLLCSVERTKHIFVDVNVKQRLSKKERSLVYLSIWRIYEARDCYSSGTIVSFYYEEL